MMIIHVCINVALDQEGPHPPAQEGRRRRFHQGLDAHSLRKEVKEHMYFDLVSFCTLLYCYERQADGELCLRRAPALLRPTFLGA